MKRSVTVQRLSPTQGQPWTFHLDATEKGGVVSVPSVQGGYPIDWPPRHPAQAAWLKEFAPSMKAVAGAAWRLGPRTWKRLVARLDEQAEREG